MDICELALELAHVELDEPHAIVEAEDGDVQEREVVSLLRPPSTHVKGSLLKSFLTIGSLVLLQPLEPDHHLHDLPAPPLLKRPRPPDVVPGDEVPLDDVLGVMVPDRPRVDPYVRYRPSRARHVGSSFRYFRIFMSMSSTLGSWFTENEVTPASWVGASILFQSTFQTLRLEVVEL